MEKKIYPKLIWLKGNGPITVNSEMMELFAITTSHGMIGLPLKSVRAQKVYIVNDLEEFFEIHKTIKEKPCCFIYCDEKLTQEDLKLIVCEEIKTI